MGGAGWLYPGAPAAAADREVEGEEPACRVCRSAVGSSRDAYNIHVLRIIGTKLDAHQWGGKRLGGFAAVAAGQSSVSRSQRLMIERGLQLERVLQVTTFSISRRCLGWIIPMFGVWPSLAWYDGPLRLLM